jgi:hypothetical protein
MSFPCTAARDSSALALVAAALARGRTDAVRSLRRDAHERDAECCLHGDGFCLSLRAPLGG